MHDTNLRAGAVVQGDESRPVHLADDEAARAVDRIDNPREIRCSLFPTVFLPANAVIGIALRNIGADSCFRRLIGDGDWIIVTGFTLVFDVQLHAEMGQDRRASSKWQTLRYLEIA